jgi:hypothetical protein
VRDGQSFRWKGTHSCMGANMQRLRLTRMLNHPSSSVISQR